MGLGRAMGRLVPPLVRTGRQRHKPTASSLTAAVSEAGQDPSADAVASVPPAGPPRNEVPRDRVRPAGLRTLRLPQHAAKRWRASRQARCRDRLGSAAWYARRTTASVSVVTVSPLHLGHVPFGGRANL
jgi:hypothetical protein